VPPPTFLARRRPGAPPGAPEALQRVSSAELAATTEPLLGRAAAAATGVAAGMALAGGVAAVAAGAGGEGLGEGESGGGCVCRRGRGRSLRGGSSALPADPLGTAAAPTFSSVWESIVRAKRRNEAGEEGEGLLKVPPSGSRVSTEGEGSRRGRSRARQPWCHRPARWRCRRHLQGWGGWAGV